MSANILSFDLYAFAEPKSIRDIIALVHEAKAEADRLHGHLDAMFEELGCPVDA